MWGAARIRAVIVVVNRELSDHPKLTFKKTKNESEEVPRFKVALGVVPDYLFDGKGMRNLRHQRGQGRPEGGPSEG